MDYGKTPPQAIDFEEALLGAFLIDRDCHDLIDIMLPEWFYKDSHEKIFTAIKELKKNSKSIDLLTVTEQLRKTEQLPEVGGASFITQLTQKVSSGIRANEWYVVIKDKFLLREGIRRSVEIQELCYDNAGDIDEVETKLSEFKNFIETETTSEYVGSSLFEISKESLRNAKVRKLNRDNGIMPGINTGCGALQQITGGWQPSDLIYIGGRPSMGKTAFAIWLAKQSAKAGTKTCFFSLEMNDISITDRAVLGETSIDPERWRNGDVTNADFAWFEDAQKLIKRWPLILFDKNISRPANILKIVKKEKPGIIFIDYIQLMQDDKGEKHQNRNSEMESISRKLKSIGKEFNIPVIALSQLNRSLDTRASKLPVLSDLRDSGSIEQDADLVIFPYRPYVYEKDGLEETIEIHIAKHRNGRLGCIIMKHNQYINNFFEENNGFAEPEFNQNIDF